MAGGIIQFAMIPFVVVVQCAAPAKYITEILCGYGPLQRNFDYSVAIQLIGSIQRIKASPRIGKG
jgi:hypothetical protein